MLILCSENSGRLAPFITEQVDAIQKKGVSCEYFTITRKGVIGYMRSFLPMMRKIKGYNPDLIHAHYGLAGLLANLQRKKPVVTTYHGSDINNRKAFRFSKWAVKLSAYNIFVSEKNKRITNSTDKSVVIPCGIDVQMFQPMNRAEAREMLGYAKNDRLVLFAGAFDNEVKNPQLAKEAVEILEDVRLIELKGYKRNEVALLMNGVDCCLMTSHSEGSPQFVKEAMACNCPIVSVDVGDVKEVIDSVENCYLASYDAKDIAEKLRIVLADGRRTNGRDKILKMGLDSESVAKKIVEIYKSVLSKV